MAAGDQSLTVLEKCRISPPPNSVGERSLQLTFFDIAWLLFHPIHQLFFFDFPHPKSNFIETIIPNLKHSLTLTLQHFFPFAGNVIVSPTAKPQIRHVDGDSLPLNFAESDLDFNDLKQNHPRDCNKFHPLVPLLDPPFKSADLVKIPIFAIQVTIFPNSGITIGITNHHSLCDARSRHDFLMAWTSIAKHGTDEVFLATKSLPFYDRVIEYPKSLDDMLLNLPPIQTLTLDESYRVPHLEPQIDKHRSTFVLTKPKINRLKKWLLIQLPSLEYVSSFVVACGLVWSCVAKSRVRVAGAKGEYEVEQFGCAVDWRVRLSPPVPLTYFGNCMGLSLATTKTTLIIGSKGFPTAVELLATAIREAVSKDVFKDAETWLEKATLPVLSIGVAGTPKLNVYDVDFGWGKPEKYETISLDYNDSISVNASKESPEDLEIGLCLPAKQMDAFLNVSSGVLESILSQQF